jgi:uncharacterized membrane protein YphA (DoxX/SURF4 family)
MRLSFFVKRLERMKRNMTVNLALWGGLAIVVAMLGVIEGLKSLTLGVGHQTTTGTITDKFPNNHLGIAFAYKVAGHEYAGSGYAGQIHRPFNSLHAGDTVTVFYDRRYPASSTLEVPKVLLARTVGPIMAACAVLPVIAIYIIRRPKARELAMVLARLVLGALFLYMGLNKALHPVEFLKLVHQYNLVHNYLLLNIVAVGLPWFEVFCGLLLLAGVAVRGSALMFVLMLIPFTAIVLRRALTDPRFHDVPFYAIKFDCGCGTGEVFICHKLVENSLLILFSALLVYWSTQKLCLWYSVVKSGGAQKRGDVSMAI